MHIQIIEKKAKGKTYKSKLLRESYRDKNGKVKKKNHCVIDRGSGSDGGSPE
ncbi:MAG: hypothetical protein U9Q97_07985 [Acidobacteriota bacterium]|nr:hypothetical protein [Acidobacteriota bacterium]